MGRLGWMPYMAQTASRLCEHLEAQDVDAPPTTECAECGTSAPTRICLACGHIGCCDSSNGHATAHARRSKHPGIRSLPVSDKSWTWCYECQEYVA
jgi:CPA1 family monovalent cation:H+ antiporter